MWIRLLMLLTLVQPLGAEGWQRYSATLGPSESVTLTLEKDHSFQLVWHEGVHKIQATASGRFRWQQDDLDLTVAKILFVGSNHLDYFDLEIRRKGVEGPPPTLHVEAGQEIHLKIHALGDSVQLRRPPDWELTLYLKH